MPLLKIKKLAPPVLSLRRFHNRMNKLLIYRTTGGLGDILMHRMMFEDFKRINPEIEITFACLPYYLEAVQDHPFIDRFVDCLKVNQEEYGQVYNTTSACTRYEMSKAPFAEKHRSDIWAEYCGVKLEYHNMHIHLTEEELDYGRNYVKNKGPVVFFGPISAMGSKNLMPHHVDAVLKHLKNKGCFVFSCHHQPIKQLEEAGIPILYGKKIRQWMSLIAASDYVVTVDSAAFHFAGELKKPLTGVFTWADGKVYGKYFDFCLVQKHRDNGNWPCGPCYAWTNCPLTPKGLKPCLTELTTNEILDGLEKMFTKWPI